jgi:hypothetical protein
MTNSLIPPPERQLPPWRVVELRTRVMAGIHKPARTAARTRQMALVTAAVIAVVAGGAATATMIRGNGGGAQVLAFGPDILSPEIEAAVDKCLWWNSPGSKDPSSLAHDPQLRVTKDDLMVSVQHGDTAAVAFMTDEGYLACEYKNAGEGTGGLAVDRWLAQRRNWLPGPFERMLLTSTEVDGGDVAVIGRVSAGVRRLVLEYGNGHTSEASFGRGMFALVSDGTPVTIAAALVSYDAAGHEIGRSALFQPRDHDACFTDPTGAVVYGKAGNNCRPAFRWR